MSIEVRQMVVKSSVLQSSEADEKDSGQVPAGTKEAILEECRRLILEALREIKER